MDLNKIKLTTLNLLKHAKMNDILLSKLINLL